MEERQVTIDAALAICYDAMVHDFRPRRTPVEFEGTYPLSWKHSSIAS